MPTPAKLPETQGEHTPGPWEAVMMPGVHGHNAIMCRAVEFSGEDWPYHPKLASVACMRGGPPRDIAEANARLIAAAPTLLAALQAVMSDPDMLATFETATRRKGIYADKSIPEFNKWCKRTAALARQLRAAIALATKGRAL